MFEQGADQQVRLDKWLWAARFFKTRNLAAIAVTRGKIHVNGFRAKPARHVQVGDCLQITHGRFDCVVVRALPKQRGPAARANLLYQETEESARQRQEIASQRRAEPAPQRHFKGRPVKKDRRAIVRFTRGGL
ncbi:MAG: RNA-binding S4 domain-containing protein [Candidatus Binatia bacterium]